MTLVAQMTDGSSVDLTHVDGLQNSASPFSHEFTWSGQFAKIAALRVRVDTPNTHSSGIFSSWAAVSDPAPAPSASLTVNSFSRNSDGSASVDATGTTTGYMGTAACPFGSDCYMTLVAQMPDGSSFDITNVHNLPSSYPYTNHFTWTGKIGKVAGWRIRVDTPGTHSSGILSDVAPVNDPAAAAVASIAVNSVYRNSDGSLSVSASGTATGYMGTNGCPFGSDCYMTLSAKLSDGSVTDLTHVDNLQSKSYPFTQQFTWSGQIAQVAALQVRVDTPNTHGNAITSGWTAVTEGTAPTPPAASVSVGSVTRNADGSVAVDATGSASEYMGTSACPAGSDCFMTLVAQKTDGTSVDLTNVDGIQNDAYPFSHEFTWTGQSAKIVALRVRVDTPNTQSNGIFSPWVTVNDPEPAPSAAISVGSVTRNSDGSVSIDATGTASGYMGTSTCGFGSDCFMTLVAQMSDGTSFDVTNVHNLPATYPYTNHFTWSGSLGKITALRIRVDNPPGHYNPIFSDWSPVPDITAAEQAGGNPALANCGCSHSDPVNTETGEFYENSSDLTLPGAPAALTLTRGYSTVRSQTDGPFGYGSSSNITMDLTTSGTGTPAPTVTITQEQGSVVTFALNGSGAYTAGPEIRGSLTYDATTGQYTYTRQRTAVFTFNQSGQLLTVGDPHGVTATYAYSGGQVSQISASGGRTISLTWSGSHITAATDSAGRSTTYSYDSSGNLTAATAVDGATTHYGYSGHLLTSLTKPGGGVTTNTYDGSNRVVSQTNPDGKVTSFAYNGAATTMTAPDGNELTETYANGALASRVDGAQSTAPRKTTFTYDTADNLTSEMDPLGHTTTYTYDSAGNVLTKTDPLGKRTTYTYDALRDVLTTTDPLNRTTTNTFNAAGDRLSSTDPAGNTQSWTYNPDGSVASWTNQAGGVTKYTYDAAGNPTTVTDPDGRTTTTTYNSAEQAVSVQKPAAAAATTETLDAAGRVLTLTDPLGHTSTNTYDADGNLLTSVAPSGATTKYQYDAADLKTSATNPDGHTSTYTYDGLGRLTATTDASNHTTKTGYDTYGEKTSLTDADGNTTTYSYDAAGELTGQTAPSGAVTTFAYDADGRKTDSTDADGNTTTYAYDAAGELTASTDPLHRTTTTTYTADGRTDTVTRPDSSTEQYRYDALGDTISFQNADGAVASYRFDAAGLMTGKTEPGNITTTYAYNAAGELGTATDANGTATVYSYDDAGKLTSVTAGSDPATTYTYDADGNRVGMTDATGTSTFAYDKAGQMTAETNAAAATIGYAYDPVGNLTTLTYPGSGRSVTYSYDAANRVTAVQAWTGQSVSYTYDKDGLEATQTDGNGLTQTLTRDANGHVTDMAAAAGGSVADFGYTYDAASELIAATTSGSAMTAASNTYTYDPVGQVAADSAGSYTTTSGGLIQTASNGNTLTYNSAQELTGMTTPASGTAGTATNTTYTYDADGNRLTATTGTTTLTSGYDASGRLTSVSGTPDGTISYTVNGNGLRTSRTDTGTTNQWTWDTNRQLPLLLDDGNNAYIYGIGNTPAIQISDTTTAADYLTTDLIGSVRLATDSSGTALGTTNYTTYGTRASQTGTPSPLGYTGAWTDPATGLVYLRARNYDPTTGQFTSIDAAIDTTRLAYVYTSNDPLTMVDPTGLCDTFDAPDGPGGGPATWGWGGDDYGTIPQGAGPLPKEAPTAAPPAPATEIWQQSLPLQADAAAGGMAGVRAAGTGGERAAGIVKNSSRIPSLSGTASYRIPDELSASTLGEVKNVSSLSYTSQLRDFQAYAQSTGRTFDLYVRGSTTFSGPLQDAIDAGQINVIRNLPG